MDIAIMQPYLFPYIGYFQMLNGVDYFVSGENVQFIKKGWINRNRILVNNEARLITLPLIKDSTYLDINKRYFENDSLGKDKMLRAIHNAYHKASNFKDCYQLVEEILNFSNYNVAAYIHNSFKEICSYLDIKTPLLILSELDPPPEMNSQDLIIHVCKGLKADRYINAIGGMELYSDKKFRENDLTLRFIKTKESLKYKQFNDNFVPNLSIIDVMMFNSPMEIRQLLTEYDLIDGKN